MARKTKTQDTKTNFRTFAEIVAELPKKAIMVPLAALVARTDTQARVKTSATAINDYRDAYRGAPDFDGKTISYDPDPTRLPPIIVAPAADHEDANPDAPGEARFYLIDGDHRATAASRAGLDELPALVAPPMTLQEARFAVLGANATHGLSRSNADKQNACRIACETATQAISARATKKKNGEWGKISYTGTLANGEKITARALADVAGVSHEMAAQHLRTTYAAQFSNGEKPKKDDDKPTGNAKDDNTPDAPEVDDGPRDLTANEPTEYAHSLIKAASGDFAWIAAVSEVLALWVENHADAS